MEKAGRPQKKATDAEPARQRSDNPSHIDMSLDSELKPELLNQSSWKTGKGKELLSQRGCGAPQQDSWHRFPGNILAHVRDWLQQVLKEAMLRPSLQGNILYNTGPFDGTLGRSLEDA